MDSMHIGTQAVTVLKSNWIDSLDSVTGNVTIASASFSVPRRIASAFWLIFCRFYNVNVPVICLQQQLQGQAYENTERV